MLQSCRIQLKKLVNLNAEHLTGTSVWSKIRGVIYAPNTDSVSVRNCASQTLKVKILKNQAPKKWSIDYYTTAVHLIGRWVMYAQLISIVEQTPSTKLSTTKWSSRDIFQVAVCNPTNALCCLVAMMRPVTGSLTRIVTL